MSQKVMYQQKYSKTIYKDEKISLGIFIGEETKKRTLRITWGNYNLVEAKLTVSAYRTIAAVPGAGFDAYIDGNNLTSFFWQSAESNVKTETKEISDLLRNGDNIFEFRFWKDLPWLVRTEECVFTAILDYVVEIPEGSPPPSEPSETKFGLTNTELLMLSIGVAGVGLSAYGLVRKK